MIDVAELMTDPDFTETVQLLRPTISTANEGIMSRTYAVPVNIIASVQPVQPDEAQSLPEGTRLGNLKAFYTATLVRCNDASSVDSDVIVHGGKNYRVIAVEPWGSFGYYKAIGEGFVKGGA